MLYAAFALWLLLIVLTAVGVQRLWAALVRPVWVQWALLPGTLVAQMAYIFGSLITGGEVRKARLLPKKGEPKDSDAAAAETSPRMKLLGPAVASLMVLLACGAGILLANRLLGDTVVQKFVMSRGVVNIPSLPQELPTSWSALWGQVEEHIALLRLMFETLGDIDWLDWRTPLFVYLAACLSVRLAPAGKDLRAALAAVVFVAAVVAGVGLASDRFENWLLDLWPVLTYVWANLLMLLTVSLLVHAVVALMRTVSGKR
ncbi:MAG: hypothetical protein ACP5HU_09730 [Phycisphaerae bacterium]